MRAAARRLLPYAALLAVQARAVRGVWEYRDLTAGDTAHYFVSASWWADAARTNPLWSPLYQVFYGTLVRMVHDPFVATTLHRLLLVALLDVVVLALLRRLLPPAAAFLGALWFALLPVNYDTLYEVHLAGAIPPLLAALAVARAPGSRGRGLALGTLAGGALLLRNELAIAAALWAVSCVVLEARGRTAPRALLRPYGAPLLAVAVAAGALLAHPAYPLSQMRPLLHAKHTLNVCQIYAFGYAQRHDDWHGDPWTGCAGLMRRDFGSSEPTMGEAFRANPRAMLEHVAWNLRLVPAGTQLQLFGMTSGGPTPDYLEPRRRRVATFLSALALALLAAGALLARCDPWWRAWWAVRRETWLLLGCVAAGAAVVMLTQRPRPSYLFAEAVALHALLAAAGFAVWRRIAPERALVPFAAVVAVAAFALVPRLYRADHVQTFGQVGQPLRRAVERLLPFRRELARPAARLLLARFPFETCAYVGGRTPCTGLDPGALGDAPDLARAEAKGVGWIYVEEQAPEALAELARAALEGGGWERRAGGEGWLVLSRR